MLNAAKHVNPLIIAFENTVIQLVSTADKVLHLAVWHHMVLEREALFTQLRVHILPAPLWLHLFVTEEHRSNTRLQAGSTSSGPETSCRAVGAEASRPVGIPLSSSGYIHTLRK